MADLPPRSAVLATKDMLVDFDVDCGELVPGHRFVARGLAREPRPDVRLLSQEAAGWADRWDDADIAEMITLEYEFVPGLAPEHQDSFFDVVLPIRYEPDVPLSEPAQDGGAIAPFTGGDSTHGTRGAWPIPVGAQFLRFVIGTRDEEDHGELVVDLDTRRAAWRILRA